MDKNAKKILFLHKGITQKSFFVESLDSELVESVKKWKMEGTNTTKETSV